MSRSARSPAQPSARREPEATPRRKGRTNIEVRIDVNVARTIAAIGLAVALVILALHGDLLAILRLVEKWP